MNIETPVLANSLENLKEGVRYSIVNVKRNSSDFSHKNIFQQVISILHTSAFNLSLA